MLSSKLTTLITEDQGGLHNGLPTSRTFLAIKGWQMATLSTNSVEESVTQDCFAIFTYM